MTGTPRLTILGGGPAGLACGYFAARAGVSFRIFEAAPRVGGNAVTFEHEGFRFDSGAHRFHAKDAEMTKVVVDLLGTALRPVAIGSHIWDDGRWVDFPLSPLNLLSRLGPVACGRAALSLVAGRLRRGDRNCEPGAMGPSFEEVAVRRYGREIAERYLFNYSEKLWGKPPAELAADISSYRLRGLSLTAFLAEAMRDHRAKTRHLDGSFYYPELGIGQIAEALSAGCGAQSIVTDSPVTRLLHDGRRVSRIEVGGGEIFGADEVVSTLPLSLLPRLLDPAPPEAVLTAAERLRFRSLVLVVLLLDRERVTSSGTIYFPSAEVPFTRVYEPRNRSPKMAPAGQTSLCVEIPCAPDGETWKADDAILAASAREPLEALDWFRPDDVLDTLVVRLPRAYPVLDLGFAGATRTLFEALEGLGNLSVIGRNGRFEHSSVHHMLRAGKDAVDALLGAGS